MGFFSKAKNAKKAADERKNALKVQDKTDDTAKVPYRHIPTHAADDFRSGTAIAVGESNKEAIKQAVNRRSILAESRANSTMSIDSRNSSYLSNVSTLYNPISPSPAVADVRPKQMRLDTRRSYTGNNGGYVKSPLASNAQSPTNSYSSDDLQAADVVEIAEVVERPNRYKRVRYSQSPIEEEAPPVPTIPPAVARSYSRTKVVQAPIHEVTNLEPVLQEPLKRELSVTVQPVKPKRKSLMAFAMRRSSAIASH